ncbi:MAG: C39 family peptidase [Candidatus Berkelbacteria bacterium]|nr:C39 family peptidase [Candidatus Berkelbacteria bacterium]
MNKRTSAYLVIIFITALGALFYFVLVKNQKTVQDTPDTSTPTTTQQEAQITQAEPTPEQKIPDKYELKVPFLTQAPYTNWDELHENACEEASAILVHYYKKGLKLTTAEMENQILKMVDYEIKKYNKHKNLTAKETAELIKEFYGYKNVRVVYDFSWDDLKKEIVKGNPVIVPAAGRLLKNPNFRGAGPVYHMFVIKGYNSKEIITNDVGTRKGNGYRYTYKTLDLAIHDWTGYESTINSGRRVMIIMEK